LKTEVAMSGQLALQVSAQELVVAAAVWETLPAVGLTRFP
jgi:hypothetical protein